MSDASNEAAGLLAVMALEVLVVAVCVWAMEIPELTFSRAMGGVVLLSLATRRERA